MKPPLQTLVALVAVALLPSLASAQQRYERVCVNGVCSLRLVADPFAGYPLPVVDAPKVAVPPPVAYSSAYSAVSETQADAPRGPLRRIMHRIRTQQPVRSFLAEVRPGVVVPKRGVSVSEIVPYDSGVIPQTMPQRPATGAAVCACTICPRNSGGVCICDLCPRQ